MSGDPKLITLWNSIDTSLLLHLDSLEVDNYWKVLIPLFYELVEDDVQWPSLKRSRDIAFLMRSLMVTPNILQPSYNKSDMFTLSAKAFYESYKSTNKSEGTRLSLLRTVFVDFHTFVSNCPDEYLHNPSSFIQELSVVMMKDPKSNDDYFTEDLNKLDTITRAYEVYADICKVSPYIAMQLTESHNLWPSQPNFTGRNLQETPFFAQYFLYQTMSSPTWVNGHPIFPQSSLSEDSTNQLMEKQTECMSRISNAQHTILHTFLLASSISRDYVLSYIATLTDSNLSKRINPSSSSSSDGLLINLCISLLRIIQSSLTESPSYHKTQQFYFYLFSDIGRVDFLKRDFPLDQNHRLHLFYLMNWLRPHNYLAQQCNNTEWWEVLRSSETNLSLRLDQQLECKPRSTYQQFISSILSPNTHLLLSPSILSFKSLYDYSYNYFITGKRASITMPSYFQSVLCSSCLKLIIVLPCYRCICCLSFFLCSLCYIKEVNSVNEQYRPPFSNEVRLLLLSTDDVSQMDTMHNPLTHFFTELHRTTVVVSNRSVFSVTPSFAPHLPQIYHDIQHDNDIDDTDENRKQLVELYSHVGEIKHDEIYEYWDNNAQDAIQKYRLTICTCSTIIKCHCHGPVSQSIRRISQNTILTINQLIHNGFALTEQCYYCKTSPIIGTLYYCLHCSMRLCYQCYNRDLLIGAGLPGHQYNHVYILIYHPIRNNSLMDHNRNDLRTIPNTTIIIPTSLGTAGVSLDTFIHNPSHNNHNNSNLSTEIWLIVLRLMMISQTGFFQEYQQFSQISKLNRIMQLRSIQLDVNHSIELYMNLANHTSFSLLQLFTFYSPMNCPFPKSLKLHSEIMNEVVGIRFTERPNNCISQLWECVIQRIEVSPLLNILAPQMIEIIIFTFDYYLKNNTIISLKNDLYNGKLDYIIILLILCGSERVITSVLMRFDIIQLFFVLFTLTRNKDEIVFIFNFPIFRQLLLLFTQKAFVDSISFNDSVRGNMVQYHVNKMMILMLRSQTCGDEGLIETQAMLEHWDLPLTLFSQYVNDVVRQTSNHQDYLNEIVQRIYDTPDTSSRIYSQLRVTGQDMMENIKTAVNLFVRLIICPFSRSIILDGYMLHRTTRLILVVLSSLARPLYTDHIPFLQTVLRLHYDKWLCVVIEEILQIIHFAPHISNLNNEVKPSVAVSLDPDPSYRNAVLISLVEDDGLFSEDMFIWIMNYCKINPVLNQRRLIEFCRIVDLIRSYYHHFDMLNKSLIDTPEEFYDSVMDTIMQDPVILPSGNKVDRGTVVRLLTVNPIDPFTRAPLTMEMVISDGELKQKIKDYLKNRMNELKNKTIRLKSE